jgi:two-component sensor histidine kinase
MFGLAMRTAVTLHADLEAPYRARRWLDELQMPLAPDRADVVELLAAELVTASVKHAMRDGIDGIDVALRAERGVVRIEVSDPSRRGRPEVPEDPDAETGFGFYLVDKLADRWGFSGGRSPGLWFELDVYRLPAGSPEVSAS